MSESSNAPNPDCPVCHGSGGWTDTHAKQSLFCYLCFPEPASLQSRARVSAPTWCPETWEKFEAKFYGPRFQVDPWLLVLHSGDRGAAVAEYISDPGDGRKVSTHISYSLTSGDYVQQVPFDRVAWHCGGSRYQGRGKLNFCSIGIELPGPWDKIRTEQEWIQIAEQVAAVTTYWPSLKVCVTHRQIDAGKKDFEPVEWSYLEGFGLEMPFR